MTSYACQYLPACGASSGHLGGPGSPTATQHRALEPRCLIAPGTRPDLLALIRELSDVGSDGILPVALEALTQDDENLGIRFLLADVEERVLIVWDRIGHDRHPNVGSVRVEGSEHGRVYRTGEVVHTTIGGHAVLLAPVTVRRERIGCSRSRGRAKPANTWTVPSRRSAS